MSGFSFSQPLGGSTGALGNTATPSSIPLSFSAARQTADQSTTAGAPSATKYGLTSIPTTIPLSAVNRKTKYTELPEEWRMKLELIEKHMKDQSLKIDQLQSRSTENYDAISDGIQRLKRLLSTLSTEQEQDAIAIGRVKQSLHSTFRDIDVAVRHLEQLRLPMGSILARAARQQSPVSEYFIRLVQMLERRMHDFYLCIEDVERSLKILTKPCAITPGKLSQVLRAQQEAFLSLAGRISTTISALHTEKEAYLNYRRKFFNEHVNPFKKPALPADSLSMLDEDIPLATIAARLPTSGTQAPSSSAGPAGIPSTPFSQPSNLLQPSSSTSFTSFPSTGGLPSSLSQPQQQQSQPQPPFSLTSFGQTTGTAAAPSSLFSSQSTPGFSFGSNPTSFTSNTPGFNAMPSNIPATPFSR